MSEKQRPSPSGCALGRLLLLLPLIPAFLLAAAPAYAAFPGANGKIAFSTWVDGNQDIYTMNADGTGMTRLTTDPAEDEQPVWSSSGSKIAFISQRDGPAWSIYVMNADGSGQTRLTGGVEPAWSPDGNEIAFCVDPSGTAEVYVINADGSGLSPLTSGCAPDWSPSGDEIVFSDEAYESGISKINVDGSGRVSLLPWGGYPDWSPDGQKIAFSDGSIYVMDADGGSPQTLNTPNYSVLPAWSPDSTKIVFTQQMGSGNPSDIWTMNANGTGQTNITNSAVSDATGDWQPILYGYARPKGATQLVLRFVPAYEPCTSANASHGAPLAVISCSPPVAASEFLTVGTPDANGAAANSAGLAIMRAICNPPAPGPVPPCASAGDQGDEEFQISITDVRQKTTLLDYTGELEARMTLRITDRWNGLCSGCPQPGTATDVPFRFAVPCATTPSGSVGSTCSVTTTANAVLPGTVRESKRSVWQLGQFELYDGGPDGDADTPASNTLFAVQGLFAP